MLTTVETKQAYELAYNLDHLADTNRERDAYIVEWPEYREFLHPFVMPNDFEYPAHGVEFHGYESALSNTDYPYSNVSWPIISKRMLKTLLDVREFPYRTWDVPFVGFPDNAHEELLRRGLSGGVRHDDEFVAIQLLEHLDVFDFEKSEYRTWKWGDEPVRDIQKLVLHIPEGGLPPIFRMNVFPTYWYVSPEARTALEAADIKGVRFIGR